MRDGNEKGERNSRYHFSSQIACFENFVLMFECVCVLPFALLRSSVAHLSSTNGSQNIAAEREKSSRNRRTGKNKKHPGKKECGGNSAAERKIKKRTRRRTFVMLRHAFVLCSMACYFFTMTA